MLLRHFLQNADNVKLFFTRICFSSEIFIKLRAFYAWFTRTISCVNSFVKFVVGLWWVLSGGKKICFFLNSNGCRLSASFIKILKNHVVRWGINPESKYLSNFWLCIRIDGCTKKNRFLVSRKKIVDCGFNRLSAIWKQKKTQQSPWRWWKSSSGTKSTIKHYYSVILKQINLFICILLFYTDIILNFFLKLQKKKSGFIYKQEDQKLFSPISSNFCTSNVIFISNSWLAKLYLKDKVFTSHLNFCSFVALIATPWMILVYSFTL